MVSINSLLRPGLEDLEPYEPVRPLDVIARELGIATDDLAKLDANENLYGPIPAVREAAANADLHIYPDPAQDRLVAVRRDGTFDRQYRHDAFTGLTAFAMDDTYGYVFSGGQVRRITW